MRISDWSSDVCSSDLRVSGFPVPSVRAQWPGSFFYARRSSRSAPTVMTRHPAGAGADERNDYAPGCGAGFGFGDAAGRRCGNHMGQSDRSEEHTSELQSLMRISYADFCLKKKKYTYTQN